MEILGDCQAGRVRGIVMVFPGVGGFGGGSCFFGDDEGVWRGQDVDC